MKGYNNIKDKLTKLPVHTASEMLWEDIEETLPHAGVFNKLPNHFAPQDLWDDIQTKLAIRKSIRLTPYWIAAASVIIIFSLTLLFKTGSQNEQIMVAEEIITVDFVPEKTSGMNKEITVYCDQYPTICSSDRFTRLKKQLDELKSRKKELNTLKSFDSDPRIDVYIEHINLELSTIERKLIAMF